LMKRNLRPFKHCASPHGEIEIAGVAVVETDPLADGDLFAGSAVRANRASGPETTFEIDPRRFVVGKHLEEFESADSRTAHDLIVDEYRGKCKLKSTVLMYIIPFYGEAS